MKKTKLITCAKIFGVVYELTHQGRLLGHKIKEYSQLGKYVNVICENREQLTFTNKKRVHTVLKDVWTLRPSKPATNRYFLSIQDVINAIEEDGNCKEIDSIKKNIKYHEDHIRKEKQLLSIAAGKGAQYPDETDFDVILEFERESLKKFHLDKISKTQENQYKPETVTPAYEYIKEAITEANMSIEAAAVYLDMDVFALQKILTGESPITHDLATLVQTKFKIFAKFLMNQQTLRQALSENKKELKPHEKLEAFRVKNNISLAELAEVFGSLTSEYDMKFYLSGEEPICRKFSDRIQGEYNIYIEPTYKPE